MKKSSSIPKINNAAAEPTAISEDNNVNHAHIENANLSKIRIDIQQSTLRSAQFQGMVNEQLGGLQEEVDRTRGTTGSNSQTIQRAIGFEFETNAELKKDHPYKFPLHDQSWDGKNVTEYGPGWHAHVDGGRVEFITQPIEEEADLEKQMNRLSTSAEMLEYNLAKSDKKAIGITEAMGLGSNGEYLITKAGNKNLYNEGIYADIQNTVSLTLEEVPRFYEAMPESDIVKPMDKVSHKMYTPWHMHNAPKLTLPAPSSIAKQHVGQCIYSNTELWKPINTAYPDISSSVGQISTVDLSWVPKYEGFATIIVDYLNSFVISNSFKKPSEYVKSDFPLLVRVNFIEMIGSMNLDEEAQVHFSHLLNQLVLLWVNVLLVSNPEAPEVTVIQQAHDKFKGDNDWNAFLNAIPTLKASENMKQKDLPTTGEWIENMKVGKDLLSSRDNSKLDSGSMGNLKMDQVESEPKTIIENRALGTRNPVGSWEGLAKTVYEDYNKKKQIK